MEKQLLQQDTGWKALTLDSGMELWFWPHDDAELAATLSQTLEIKAESERLDRPVDHEAKVFVISMDAPGASTWIYELRHDPKTRLSPIIAVKRSEEVPIETLAADRVMPLDPSLLRTVVRDLEDCVVRILMLPPADHVSISERQELDMVRYFYTRQSDCVRVHLDPLSRVGFRIPVVESILGLSAIDALDALEEYRELGYFEGHIEEQLYLCRSCRSVRLIFRETCPRCHVPSLQERATIHHFRCAYVADKVDFIHGDELICPKCDKRLRHVGVDHDFPENTLHCAQCDESWAEGAVEVRCLECAETSDVEHAHRIQIRSYTPTRAMRRAAKMCQSPLLSNSKAMTLTLESIEPAVFRLLKEHTRTVARRYHRDAKILRIDTRGLYDHYDVAGHVEYRSLLVEIAKRLKASTRIGDATAVTRDCAIEILLPETTQEEAVVVLERINQKILEIEGLSGHIGYSIQDLTEKEDRG